MVGLAQAASLSSQNGIHRRPSAVRAADAAYQAIAGRIAREQAGPVLDWGTGFGQVAKILTDAEVDVTAFEYRPDLGLASGRSIATRSCMLTRAPTR